MMNIIFSFFFVHSKYPPEVLKTACSFSLTLEDQVQHTYLGLAPVLFPFHFSSWCEGPLQEKKTHSYLHLLELPTPFKLEVNCKNRFSKTNTKKWDLLYWGIQLKVNSLGFSLFLENLPTVFLLYFTLLQMSVMTYG